MNDDEALDYRVIARPRAAAIIAAVAAMGALAVWLGEIEEHTSEPSH